VNRCYSPSVIAGAISRTSLGFCGCLWLVLSLAACGRPATEQDCQLIVDRNVELAEKDLAISDPAAVDKRKEKIRTEQQEGLKACIGKNVTDGMIRCIKEAQKAEDIDGCFR
jgi:hypothetical protein